MKSAYETSWSDTVLDLLLRWEIVELGGQCLWTTYPKPDRFLRVRRAKDGEQKPLELESRWTKGQEQSEINSFTLWLLGELWTTFLGCFVIPHSRGVMAALHIHYPWPRYPYVRQSPMVMWLNILIGWLVSACDCWQPIPLSKGHMFRGGALMSRS